MIDGIDISHHQGPDVNFDKVYASGRRFVYVKATEGQDYVDPQFRHNWAALRCREDKLLRGVFHFARWDTDGGTVEDAECEAINMCSLLAGVGGYFEGCLPPALDFEWGSTGGSSEEWSEEKTASVVAWISRWVEVVEAELGRSPMIYTGRRTWLHRVGYSSRFVHLPLWQADYDGKLGEMPWSKVTIHQYGVGDAGSVPGVGGRCDLDRFLGSPAGLLDLARPQLFAPARDGSVMPWLDLGELSPSVHSHDVAIVQGLLLASGLGPDGLVGLDGRPDGKPGAKTRKALDSFRRGAGLGPGYVVDGATWWALLRHG